MVRYYFIGKFIQKGVKKVIIWKNEKLRKAISNFEKYVPAGAGRKSWMQSTGNFSNRERGCGADGICRAQTRKGTGRKGGRAFYFGMRRMIMNDDTEREELIQAIVRLLAEASTKDIRTVYIFAVNLI